eukprot:13794079-Ditylum_brightwellii.AAC.1
MDSSCMNLEDESMCKSAYDEETGLPCAWCKSGAVKDDCLPSNLAKSLPPGVFDCSSRAYDLSLIHI